MMHRDFPLQQRVRHRNESLRSAFVQAAKSILRNRHDCGLEESEAGLTLLGRSEEDLAHYTGRLRQHFGVGLQVSALQVRLLGTPLCEPIMHVHVNVPASRIESVKQQLRRRSIAIREESCGGTRCLLQAEAPMRQLLGLGADLKCLTLGSSLLWTALARYEPCSPEPSPAAA